jgi:WD40 repeat protein/serine/threonine protein kinase
MSSPENREAALFAMALERSPETRAAFLDAICEGNAGLRQRLDQLLAAHDQPEALLDTPAEAERLREKASPKATLKLEFAEAPDESIGQSIGRYKLLEKVGEGGCGVVYVAEQTEPVRRRVALKVIKLGMDTKAVVARFEAERQALAMMDHPNIARVLDAGTTDAGRPYFIMELVRGIKITEYCDQNNLPTNDRLDLFIKICQAIQHAHQKGIIHRDIKPSNILVTLHDGVPVPKVIDFGIAKATEGRLTEATVYTQLHQFIGTPAYMSPEQAEMSGLDIDTRSDIYSLGVLLYELLTSKTPFDANELMSQGIDAMRRTIREKEPVRPSTRLATLQGEELTTTAKRRSSDAPRLIHLLRGDLDWIVMKCLEKDRTRRYETANGLAMDLRRHLINEPVIARPPSKLYRVHKALRRNKLIFAAASSVVAALLMGAIVSGWQALRANRAREAEAMARRLAERNAATAHLNAARVEKERERTEIEKKRAEASEFAMRQRAYAAEINVAFQALAENNLARARELLDRQRPKPGAEDLRGFEWRHLWQLCRPDEIASFQDQEAIDAAFSPDGRLFAYGNAQIIVRDLASRQIVATIPHLATTVMFSPTTNLLASSAESGVTLWNTGTWREMRSLPDTHHPAVFSPDGQWLVTGAKGGFRIWNTKTWEAAGVSCQSVPYLEWHARHAVVFSPDGKLLVTPGSSERNKNFAFQVWTFPELKLLTNFAISPGFVGAAAFTPDGKNLLTGRWEGELDVWDVTEGKIVETHRQHNAWITDIAFATDGNTFATTSSDRSLVLWNTATRLPLARLRGHLGEVWCLAMSPDGRTLVSGSQDSTTKLWDTSTRHAPTELPGSDNLIGFSDDGRLLIASTPKGAVLWDVTAQAKTQLDFPGSEHSRFNLSRPAAVQPRQPLIVFGHPDGLVEIWNAATRARVASWPAFESRPTATAFSPDGKFVAAGTVNGSAKLWNTATQHEVGALIGASNVLFSLTFSPNGQWVAGCGDGQIVWVWNVNDLRLALALPDHKYAVSSIAFSPDNQLLAASTLQGNDVKLWEIPSGKLRATLKGHLQGVIDVAFTPDGKTLATGSHDRKVKLWNVATEQELATLPVDGVFTSLRFSPDGRTLAIGYGTPELSQTRLWHAPSWEEIASAERQGR